MEEQYKMLIGSIKLLALTYEEQKKILPDFVVVPDEVTSNFENAFYLLPDLVGHNKFSNNSIASILRLYNMEQLCISNQDLYDFSNAEWDKIRKMAKDTLQVMGEQIEPPEKGYF